MSEQNSDFIELKCPSCGGVLQIMADAAEFTCMYCGAKYMKREQAQTPQEKEEELGDILFCVVNLARWHKIDPESALRMSNLKFYDRVHYVEKQALDRYPDLFSMPRDEKEMYWNEYKAAGKPEEQS